jgi:sister-chromatid-cohesion protein PDS5
VDFAHLLAHHPDFSMETDDLQTFEVYLKFFLDTLATSENIAFLYYAGAQLKMVRTRNSEKSINLYVISEMIQVLIREHCASNNWILQTYPGKVGLPRDLFEKLPAEESSTVMKTIYLEAQSDYMKHRTQPKTKTPKSKPQKRTSPIKADDETDSDSTQVDGTPIKRKKTPKKHRMDGEELDTPMRRSERTKKSLRSNLIEHTDSD